MTAQEKEILSKYCDSDLEFWDVFRENSDRIRRFCLSISKSRNDGEDLYSEVMIKTYDSYKSITNKQALLSFMFTIAVRTNNSLKNRLKRITHTDDDFEFLFSEDKGSEHYLDAKLLYEALNTLGSMYKEAIILCDIEGFTYKEIAVIQKTSESNVKSRLKRGRKKLREILEIK